MKGHFSSCPVFPGASFLLLPIGLWTSFWLNLNSLPELSCRCSGPTSWMGWAPWFLRLYLPDRFCTRIAAFSLVLFLAWSCSAPDRNSWMDHGSGSLLAISGGCQNTLWPEAGPTFRERTIHFGICLGSFEQKRPCFTDPGSEKKSDLFYQPFKSMTQLSAQSAGKALLWVCDAAEPPEQICCWLSKVELTT